jgi:hypothetical protein
MSLDLSRALVVGPPLRGEWMASRSPAMAVPSHGTDMLGQRYAFDFVRVGPDGHAFAGLSRFRFAFAGGHRPVRSRRVFHLENCNFSVSVA